ncbi:MAG: hemerythrin domain-containing protein [Hyphomonadaceae bacterium]
MAKKAKTARKSGAKRAKSNGNGRSKPADAIALLKADHRTVEALFEEFEDAKGSKAKQRIANQICMELIVHAQIEEEIFYPALKDAVEDDVYTEAHVEHDGAKVLIAEILAGNPEDEFYDASVKVLSEMIKHHVHEEEMRDGMFSQARQSDVDLEALGEQLEQRKTDLTGLYKRNGLPRPKTRTLKSMPKVELGHPVA